MKHTKGPIHGRSRNLKKKKRPLKPTTLLKTFKRGDRVRIVINASFPKNMPPLKFNNYMGVVERKQGKAYIVKVRDLNKAKYITIPNVHLLVVK